MAALPRIPSRILSPVGANLSLLGVLIGIAALGPVFWRLDPTAMDVVGRFASPSWQHPLGQDDFGRDVFSRLLHGARTSLGVAFATAAIAGIIGTLAGIVGGYFGRIWEFLTLRVSDVLLAFPPILLALMVAALFGPSAFTLIACLSILYMPGFARVAYGETLSLKRLEYVEAQRALGARDARIVLKTLLPNMSGPLFVQFSLTASQAIIVEAGLSFLGLGIVPPTPSWGLMIRSARSQMEVNPIGLLWPSLALLITVFMVNRLCDALQAHFDPRMSTRKARWKWGGQVAKAPLPPALSVSGTTPILDVRNLQTRFMTNSGPVTAVENVSFQIQPGETLAIVGESGSGKSVTAFSIMGLNARASSRTDGSVLLNGRELLALSDKDMRSVRGNEIAMIFQEPMTSLNPVLTVGTQIVEALMAHRDLSRRQAGAEAIRLLEKVRIPAPASRMREYPHKLSGGMRQRVMIAMALACRPKLLIADEPTTALDVTIQAQILDLIRTLQSEEGMSVLFITHDMGVVAEIADRTIVMYNGEAVETGATADIFARPQHPYTRSLLSAVPSLGSMNGHSRPMRFPVVDRSTGEADQPVEVPDTVKDTGRPLLEVKNLTKRFDLRSGLLSPVVGRVHAVENVSFTVKAGETLALVGESGCGKSTTGRAVLRLIEPQAGSIVLDGVDIARLSPKELREQRKRMQMIFQDPFASLNPRMSAGDAIAEPLIVNSLASRAEVAGRVADLLESVGLKADMASRFPHEFSGGQRQRICIARALSLEPRLLVADEAVSALDVSVKAQVVNLMLDLQARMGLGYLFISHDMAVVERVSHRVAVMYLGEIVEIGPRQAIFENPRHPYTKRLLAAVPIADPARRQQKRVLSNDEVKSPIRPPDYTPPERRYQEVGPGHVVMQPDDEWS